jgi:hypothetical protein
MRRDLSPAAEEKLTERIAARLDMFRWLRSAKSNSDGWELVTPGGRTAAIIFDQPHEPDSWVRYQSWSIYDRSGVLAMADRSAGSTDEAKRQIILELSRRMFEDPKRWHLLERLPWLPVACEDCCKEKNVSLVRFHTRIRCADRAACAKRVKANARKKKTA